MLSKIKNIKIIESVKTKLHYSMLGAKIACLITTIAFPPAAFVTIPMGIGLTIADYSVTKSSDSTIRKLKGQHIKFDKDDVGSLVWITVDLMSMGLFSQFGAIKEIANVTLTGGAYA